MKNLVYAALLLGGLAQASGCLGDWGDDDTGRFKLTWTISTNDNQALDCAAADADTVVLTATRAGSATISKHFHCEDMAGTTDELALGSYRVDVWLGKDTGTVDDLGDSIIELRSTEILQVDNRVLRQSGADVSLGGFDFNVATSGDSDDDTGRFNLTWIISTNDSQVLDCAAADADTVVLTLTIATEPIFTEYFDCEDMAGTTGYLKLGSYRVDVWLGKDTGTVDGHGDSIIEQRSTGILRVANIALRQSGVDVDLGVFAFNIAIPGEISFSVDYGDDDGANCDGGLGVMEQDVTVVLESDATATCVSLQLVYGPGPDDMEPDICSSTTPCVENDIIQVLASVPDGDYVITVYGLIDDPDGDSVECYEGSLSFAVNGDDDLGEIVGAAIADADPTVCGF